MNSMASQITSLTFIRAQIKENIKAPRHWPLCGKFTGTGEFPVRRASNAENVSIWWRHHDIFVPLPCYSRSISSKIMPTWKKVESWNFQESYLDAHLTPWCKVPLTPWCKVPLTPWWKVAIATSCLFKYNKASTFFNICHRKTDSVCIPMLWNTGNTMELLFQQ